MRARSREVRERRPRDSSTAIADRPRGHKACARRRIAPEHHNGRQVPRRHQPLHPRARRPRQDDAGGRADRVERHHLVAAGGPGAVHGQPRGRAGPRHHDEGVVDRARLPPGRRRRRGARQPDRLAGPRRLLLGGVGGGAAERRRAARGRRGRGRVHADARGAQAGVGGARRAGARAQQDRPAHRRAPALAARGVAAPQEHHRRGERARRPPLRRRRPRGGRVARHRGRRRAPPPPRAAAPSGGAASGRAASG